MIRTRPTLRIVGLVLGIGLSYVGVWFVWLFLHGETISEQCGHLDRHEPLTVGITSDFTVFPPGYDCVYLNPQGKQIQRTRAPNPDPPLF